jgi:hypothetical protein
MANGHYSSEMSVNAWNDLQLSLWYLTMYTVSALLCCGFAWLVSHHPFPSFAIPGIALAYAAGEVIWMHPEQPIHLFPVLWPWRPALISMSALGFATLLMYLSRRYPHRTKRPTIRVSE